MSRVRKQRVRLTATEPVEIEPGVVMPAGHYVGESRELGVVLFGGHTSWAKPEYMIEFAVDMLAEMGMEVGPSLISIEMDVTKFVELRQITVG